MPVQNQHYVPKCLLKHFTNGKKHQVYIFDKSNSKSQLFGIKKIASEKGFYDIYNENNEKASIEDVLSQIETRSSKILHEKIIIPESLISIGENDKYILSYFFAIQHLRTKHSRENMSIMMDAIVKKYKNMGYPEDKIIDYFGDKEKRSEGVKIASMRSITTAEENIPYFFNKKWCLYKTSRSDPFFTSDNPIAMHNENVFKHHGNIGLSVPGIQIYLPLSTTLCLVMFCPSIEKEAMDEYNNLMKTCNGSTELAAMHDKYEYFRSFIDGTAFNIKSDKVMFINSLQVIFSTKYLYCETNNFSLADRMIKDNEEYKEGFKIKTF